MCMVIATQRGIEIVDSFAGRYFHIFFTEAINHCSWWEDGFSGLTIIHSLWRVCNYLKTFQVILHHPKILLADNENRITNNDWNVEFLLQ